MLTAFFAVLSFFPRQSDVVKKMREAMKNRLLVGTDWQNEWDLVFTNPLGHFIVPYEANKRFKSIVTKMGRPDARFHDLRHTYAVISNLGGGFYIDKISKKYE